MVIPARLPPLPLRRRGVARRRESGYTLAALAVAISVLLILVAAALPSWSTWIQREKEEELIFRGLQYAEAIRVFQRRFGRPPVRLAELLEVQPRSIRQLWRDPITDSMDWGLVLANQARPGRPGRPGEPGAPGQPAPGEPPQAPGGGGVDPTVPGGQGGAPGSPQGGPIQGVYSKSRKESIKVFLDRQKHNEWLFTVNLLMSPGGGASGLPNLSSRWIGRPFPFKPPAGPGGGLPGNPNPGAGLPGGGLPGSGQPPGGQKPPAGG
jgi:type II secretory pathway pseudopilin PulG